MKTKFSLADRDGQQWDIKVDSFQLSMPSDITVYLRCRPSNKESVTAQRTITTTLGDVIQRTQKAVGSISPLVTFSLRRGGKLTEIVSFDALDMATTLEEAGWMKFAD